jgi:hypothetical protein
MLDPDWSRTVAIGLGRRLRRARLAVGWTQDDLGGRVGVSRFVISRMELGRGGSVPLGIWVVVSAALGVDLFAPDAEDGRFGISSLVALAAAGGWRCVRRSGSVLWLDRAPRLERPFGRPWMTVAERAVACLQDIATDIEHDLSSIATEVHRARADAVPGTSVAGLLVIRRTLANKRRLTESGAVDRSVPPRTSTLWTAALTSWEVQMPTRVGVAWMDHRATRLIPVRLAASAA